MTTKYYAKYHILPGLYTIDSRGYCRQTALKKAKALSERNPRWRVWVEDDNATRIWESDAEQQYQEEVG